MKPYDNTYDSPAAVLDVTFVNPFIKSQPKISGRAVIGGFRLICWNMCFAICV